MRSETRDRPAAYPPRVSEATRPFWEGLREEIFSTSRCEECGEMSFPPKVVCPNCFSGRLSWRPLSGKGTLYSYTRVWAAPAVFGEEVPYTLCIVDLDEGLRLGSRLLEEGGEAKVGEPVSLVFVHYSDVTLFYFELDKQ